MSNKHHVVLRKKDLGNGDLSNDIKQSLTSQNLMKSKKLSEKNNFIDNLTKVKTGQNNLNKQLKSAAFEKVSDDPNQIQKLPKKIEDFDENEDLVKLLLKNPEEMTIEEKVYIKSLSKEEFERFIKFLKVKDRELKWRGNDYGSGRYNESLISTCRDASDPFDVKYLKLKKFLKLNYNTYLASKHSESFKTEMMNYRLKSSKTMNDEKEKVNFIEEEVGSGDEMAATASTTFEETAKSIFRELDSFKNTIMTHKNNIEMKKIELQSNIVDQDLNYKSKMIKKDLQKMLDAKTKPKSELDRAIDEYKSKLNSFKEQMNRESISYIAKIKDYCERMNLTTREAIKVFDKNSILSNEVQLAEMKKQLEKLKILNATDSGNFIEMVKRYHGDPISVEALEGIIDGDIEKEFQDEEFNAAVREELDDDNYDYL
jgi:hypothetical protein